MNAIPKRRKRPSPPRQAVPGTAAEDGAAGPGDALSGKAGPAAASFEADVAPSLIENDRSPAGHDAADAVCSPPPPDQSAPD